MKPKLIAILASALVSLATTAQAVTLDFESVGPQNSGLDSTAYFASYGVTMTQTVGGPTGVSIFTVPNSASTAFQPTSGTNFIGQDAPGAAPAQFQLTLPGAGASDFSFWRIGYGPPGFTNLPQMTATFYNGATNLGSVTAPLQFDPPAQFYLFSAPLGDVITKVVFDSNGFFFTGIGGSTLDDISFTQVAAAVPLPAAMPLFATGLGALGLFAWRQKRKGAATASA